MEGIVTYFCAIHPEMRGSVTVGLGGDGGDDTAPAEQPSSEDMSEAKDTGDGYK